MKRGFEASERFLTSAVFSTVSFAAAAQIGLASGLLFQAPMNKTKTTTPLPVILMVLESISAALSTADLDRTTRLHGQAVDLLRGRPLDCCERMILGKVLDRIRKVVGEGAIVKDLEACLLAA